MASQDSAEVQILHKAQPPHHSHPLSGTKRRDARKDRLDTEVETGTRR